MTPLLSTQEKVDNYEEDEEEEDSRKNGTVKSVGGDAKMNPAFVIDDSDIPSRETSCEREVA